jgi:ankyrin repeat protein
MPMFPSQKPLVVLLMVLSLLPTLAWAGPLHDAVEVGDLNRVRLLVERESADISEIDHRGIWPLLAAASDGNTAMVKLLLKLHAHPNQLDQYHYSALHEAASLGFRDVVAILIHARADINARDINDITPLGYAVRSSSLATAKLLKDFGGTQ